MEPARQQAAAAEEVLFPLLNARRRIWAQKLTSLLEEYCALLVMPVLCIFAVYSLTKDSYGTQTFELSTNSSILFEPSPFLVSSLEIQVFDGKAGPMIYGFTSSPHLGRKSSWSESHNIVLAAGQFKVSTLWLNKGSSVNVSCWVKQQSETTKLMKVKQQSNGNAVVRILRESRSTEDWMEDFEQNSEWLCTHNNDDIFHYHVLGDGNYALFVENIAEDTLEINVTLEVLATLYNTDTAVYLCIPFPRACQLPISLFGNQAAVLTTSQYHESNSWKARVSFSVRWFMLFAALGCAVLVVAMNIKLLVYLRSRIQQHAAAEGSECDWSDYGEIEEANASDTAFCTTCQDAYKNCFFIPCGHSVTCLPCGSRLKMGAETCPTCSSPIEAVNQVFPV